MTSAEPGSLVIDTHATVWYLQQDRRLSRRAEAEIDRALAAGYPIYVPSISVVELVYLIDKGKIPAAVGERVARVLRDPVSGFRLAPLNLVVAEATRQIPREEVPDLPDRVIAATALALGLTLVTRDSKIRGSGYTGNLVIERHDSFVSRSLRCLPAAENIAEILLVAIDLRDGENEIVRFVQAPSESRFS